MSPVRPGPVPPGGAYVVLGGGGHARVVIEALRASGLTVVGLTDADPALAGRLIGGVRVLGGDDAVAAFAPATTMLANGLGNVASRTSSGLAMRARLFERFEAAGYAFPALNHPSAVVASDAELGCGAQIMAGAIVQAGARIGRNALINSRALVEHDCQVGAHVHVAPGAILCGGVRIGARSHIGAGAIILQNVAVGADVVVAAGAVVARDASDCAFVGR